MLKFRILHKNNVINQKEAEDLNTKVSWSKRHNRLFVVELLLTLMAIAILIFGFVCDTQVQQGHILVIVNDIKELSLTLIQILSSASAMILTVIAILSNSISESYLGVSVSSFYLEKKPSLFKFKTIIVIEFILWVVSIWSHIFSMYNLVIAVTMIGLIMVLYSMITIYSIYKGKRQTYAEIESYIIWLFCNPKERFYAGMNFIEDWKKCVNTQTQEDFDYYYSLYEQLVKQYLNGTGPLNEINSLSEMIAISLLEHDNIGCKEKGIRLVQQYYHSIWNWILENKNRAKDLKYQIRLICRIDYEFYAAMNSIAPDKIEKELDWESFSDIVVRVAAWIGYSGETSIIETASIISLSGALGSYIKNQQQKGLPIRSEIWENQVLNRNMMFYEVYNIPDECTWFYERQTSIIFFSFCRGLLLNGQTELVKKILFQRIIGQLFSIKTKGMVLPVLLTHCYMFYLAYRESTEYIAKSIQEEVTAVLTDPEVVRSMSHFINLMDNSKDVWDNSLFEEMRTILEKYELLQGPMVAKCIIMDGVVLDYYLFISLYLYNYPYVHDKLQNLLNLDYYLPLIQGYDAKSHLVKRLSELYKLFDCNDTALDDNNYFNRKSNNLYEIFEHIIKEKYKHKIITDAVKNQEDFEKKLADDAYIDTLKNAIYSNFDILFANVKAPAKAKKLKKYKRVHIFRADYPTRFIGDKKEIYTDYPFGNLINWITEELRKSFGVQTIVRNKAFPADKDFRQYLSDNEYKILIGSSFVFECKENDGLKEHQAFMSDKVKIFNSSSKRETGIALRKGVLSIKLDDVHIDIHSPNITEEKVPKDQKTGLFMYSPISNISLPFTEEELREYLRNERKIIDIYLDLQLGVKKTAQNNGIIAIHRPLVQLRNGSMAKKS